MMNYGAVVVMMALASVAVPCHAQVLLDGVDLYGDGYAASYHNDYGASYSSIVDVTAHVTGLFTAGERKISADEIVAQPGGLYVGIEQQGREFPLWIATEFRFTEDGPVDITQSLFMTVNQPEYGFMLEGLTYCEMLYYDSWLQDGGTILRSSCLENARLDVSIEGVVPAEQQTWSSMKQLFR